jgi:phosphomannomutase
MKSVDTGELTMTDTATGLRAPAATTSAAAAPQLAALVKAYDVRGVVADQLTSDVVHALGWAFARFLATRTGTPGTVVIAHDMRSSSPALSAAFADGVTAAGVDVIMAGLASTDLLYFASGALGLAGAMFTASHNPAQYNGIKMCLPGAAPLSLETGLADIRDEAQALLDGNREVNPEAVGRGSISSRDLLSEYASYLTSLVDLAGIRPLRVVVDAGNGMAGYTVPAVLGHPVLHIEPLYFDLDGSFPNHEANPLDPANLVDLKAAVLRTGADIGLAFDGDADRCFFVDERGEAVSPSAITAMVAVEELSRNPGATILYNLISSKAVPEIVSEAGGVPIRTRVGHSYIKAVMAETGAAFAGEHSGHYYFADFFRADTGMLAALHVLAALGRAREPLSELASRYRRYVSSGEINSVVSDVAHANNRVRDWARAHHGSVDELDGLTVMLPGGRWFNLRPSNTEPLLRLNVEAESPEQMCALRDEILALVRATEEAK